MDASVFSDIVPGAIVLSASNNSILNFINPSEEKHSSLYLGDGILDFFLKHKINVPDIDLGNYERYIIEFNTSGMAIVPLSTFLSNKRYVKIYYYMEGIFPGYKVMRQVLARAFSNYGKRYGFGRDKTYCFKMIADCYDSLGIFVRRYRILGKNVILSQSFSDDPRWLKVVDTAAGENLLTGDCNYLKWGING